MSKVLIAYVPVLHNGYRNFIERHRDAQKLFVLGEKLIARFPHLGKEIRALSPEHVRQAIDAWGYAMEVLVTDELPPESVGADTQIIMPREDVSEELSKEFLADYNVTFDTVFLRWDKHNSVAEESVPVDQEISEEEFDRNVMKNLKAEGERSSDWWRRIGAAIVKEGEVLLLTHNKHVPSDHTPYVFGDPRNNFHKGVHVELSTALHAEAGLVAEAARRGLALEGLSLYVSTFPCPPCAKQVAYSGIKKLYYTGGYGVLDGADILKEKGVSIVFVKTANPS